MKAFVSALFVSFLCLATVTVQAQNTSTAPAAAAPAAVAGTVPASPATASPSSPSQGAEEDENYSYVYEKPTVEKLSQLYWALSKFDPSDDKAIDNYLMINECDIYRDYYNNEFEWANVRKAARNFLASNKNHFPLRFEIMQPLKFGEYDLSKQHFDVLPGYQIKGITRFEVLASNYDSSVCSSRNSGGQSNIDGYPRGLLMELSRPFALTTVSVPSAIAKRYLDEKMKPLKSMSGTQVTNANIYNFRDAYLVMKVKIFSHRQDTTTPDGIYLAEVLGILEGFEIYGDSKKTNLLYSESYNTKPSKKTYQNGLDLKDTTPMLLDDDFPGDQ